MGRCRTAIRPAATQALRRASTMEPSFLGVGDHGGASPKSRYGCSRNAEGTQLAGAALQHPARFLHAVENSPRLFLPVIKGNCSIMPAAATRPTEKEISQPPRRAVAGRGGNHLPGLANKTMGKTYPAEQYAEAWWKVLFCQFHDMMAGSSLYSDYQDVRDSVGYACEVAQTTKIEALETMAKRVDLKRRQGERGLLCSIRCHGNARLWLRLHRRKAARRRSPISFVQRRRKIPVQWRPSPSMTTFVPALVGVGRTAPMRLQGL